MSAAAALLCAAALGGVLASAATDTVAAPPVAAPAGTLHTQASVVRTVREPAPLVAAPAGTLHTQASVVRTVREPAPAHDTAPTPLADGTEIVPTAPVAAETSPAVDTSPTSPAPVAAETSPETAVGTRPAGTAASDGDAETSPAASGDMVLLAADLPAPAPDAPDRAAQLAYTAEHVAPVPTVAPVDVLQVWVFSSGRLRPGSEAAVWGWHDLVVRWFPAEQWQAALCVMSWESAGRPGVVFDNPGDVRDDGIDTVGLFQVDWDNLAGGNQVLGLRTWGRYTRAEAEQALLDPDTNVHAAADMVAAAGWLPAWQAQRRRCSLQQRHTRRRCRHQTAADVYVLAA